MDIDLFSDIVKELVLDNDEVTIPGLGTFVSEVVPSVFSDKGYTINPPYRKLSFRQRAGDDSKIVSFYSKANNIDPDAARKVLADFIAGLRQLLQTRKMVVFPGLGRLRATKENTFFFIPDEDLDIYSYGFGLEPVSLKTHQETPEEVSAAVADLRAIVDDECPAPQQEPVSSPEPVPAQSAEPSAEPFSVPGQEQETQEQETQVQETPEQPDAPVQAPEPSSMAGVKKISAAKTILIVLAVLIAAAALLFGIFIILCHTAPDFVDTLLYSPEELRIINY